MFCILCITLCRIFSDVFLKADLQAKVLNVHLYELFHQSVIYVHPVLKIAHPSQTAGGLRQQETTPGVS